MKLLTINWATTEYVRLAPLLVCSCAIIGFHTAKWSRVRLILRGISPSLLISQSMVRRLGKALSFSLALVCLFLALLSPQWNEQEAVAVQEGRQLLIGLDVSGSMRANDMDPSRLEFAKNKIKKLVSHLTCDQVGLILFSGSAFVQCPLTADLKSFLLFLDHVDAQSISSGTTALDKALKKALDVYQSIPDKHNNLLLLITDGEDFSHGLAGYKQRALEQNLRVFALGVGTTQGAPVPQLDTAGNQIGHHKDANGSVAISRLDEQALTGLCQEAGGTYIPSSHGDDRDIKQIIQLIEQFEKETFESKTTKEYEQQYHWFLLAAFICLLFEWLL